MNGYNYTPMGWYHAKGDPAARLRQRKYALLRRFQIPPDALPGSLALTHSRCGKPNCRCAQGEGHPSWSLTFMVDGDRKSTRLNSSHSQISYAVFCLKKKKTADTRTSIRVTH